MLARNFLSATDLNIDPDEHQALIAVLGKFERGELVHQPQYYDITDKFGEPCGFNMARWQCGTVMCIGGWAEYINGGRFDHKNYCLTESYKLYYPNILDYSRITPTQACAALTNYLTTGNADWESILTP